MDGDAGNLPSLTNSIVQLCRDFAQLNSVVDASNQPVVFYGERLNLETLMDELSSRIGQVLFALCVVRTDFG